MNFGVTRSSGLAEKIEIAALICLGDTLEIQGAVTTLIARRRLDPAAAAGGDFRFRDEQIEPAGFGIERNQVALFDQREWPTDVAFG